MRALCLAIAFLAVLLSGPGSSALAQEPETIALLSLEISGDAPPELRQQVQAHIAKGLATGARVVGLEQTRNALNASPQLIGCFSSECLVRIGDALSATRFVRAVLVATGAHYELKLELLQVGEEELVQNSVTTSCSVCTIADLNERSFDAASRLLVIDTKKLMSVTIASIPDGAVISIDGLEAGTSPLETELEPGPHRVSAVKDGYAQSAKTVEVHAGTSDNQRFELPMIKPLGGTTAPGRDFGRLKWGTAAASGILLVVGTTLIIIDDEPTCGSTTEQCKFFHQTMLGGVLSVTGSVLSGAAAGWMFWSESQGGRRERPTVQLVPGGGTAGMAFDF